jgi:hypothetical protein
MMKKDAFCKKYMWWFVILVVIVGVVIGAVYFIK